MRRHSIIVLTIVIFTLALATVALAANPFIGTWKLNVTKSKASDPSMMPKNETVKNVAQDSGVKMTYDGVDAKEQAYHMVWTGKFDGKDYPTTGDPNVDTSAIRKVDDNTIVAVDKKAGKEVATWRVAVTKDGKTEIVAGKMKGAKGLEVTFDLVYDKQ